MLLEKSLVSARLISLAKVTSILLERLLVLLRLLPQNRPLLNLKPLKNMAPDSRNSAVPSFRLLTLSGMALLLSMEDLELLVSIPSS